MLPHSSPVWDQRREQRIDSAEPISPVAHRPVSNFELEPLGPAEEDDRSYYLIKCTPKDNTEEESNPEDYSVLWIDASTYHPCRVEQYSDGECAAAFAMTNSSYNTGLVKEDFMGPLQRKSIEDYF